jgi:hypothetical protein
MRERRGCLYLTMFAIVLAALFLLMEAFRMLVTMQIERQGESKEQQGPPRWMQVPEKRP